MKRRTLIITLTLLFVGMYGIYGARYTLLGPEVVIVSPTPYSTTERAVTVVLNTKRAKEVLVNGTPTLIDKQGRAQQVVLLREGADSITATVIDKFGNKAEKKIFVATKE
jgi:Glucodextranase, domain B